MFGNGTNHFKHAADFTALCRQGANHFNGLIDRDRKFTNLAQAAVDVLLALFGLHLSPAHFTGGVFCVSCHILHRIGDFINGSRDLIHLQGLLLTALLRLRRISPQRS